MGGWSLSFMGGDIYDNRSPNIIFNLSSNLPTHKKITAHFQNKTVIYLILF